MEKFESFITTVAWIIAIVCPILSILLFIIDYNYTGSINELADNLKGFQGTYFKSAIRNAVIGIVAIIYLFC